MSGGPKVLIFDIENSPNLGYIWGKYEQDVIAYEREWFMLCFSYKWLGQKRVHSKSLIDYKGYKKDPFNDKELVTDLWKLFDEADILIAHNGDRFDIRKANAKFLEHGLPVPAFYRTVDTLKVAKKYFYLNSNKLDDLAKHLGIGKKLQTGGFDLWKGCMGGDKKSWKTMIKYCNQDVKLLEDVYLKLRKWMTNHPNVNLVDEKECACPTCGSQKLQRRGFAYTQASKYQRFACTNCGSWSKGQAIKHGIKIKP